MANFALFVLVTFVPLGITSGLYGLAVLGSKRK